MTTLPTRILRDGILRSERIASLSPLAELFYRRLMSVVDDFGRYYASSALLLSDCYPIRPTWADLESLSLWIEECRRADLIRMYSSNGNLFLEIQGFGQRTKPGQKSKFPDFEDYIRENPGKSGLCPENPASRARSSPTPTPTPTPTPKEEVFGETLNERGSVLIARFNDFVDLWQKPCECCGRIFSSKKVDMGMQRWMSLVESGAIDSETVLNVMAGLKRYRASKDWHRDGGKYVHSVPTFLGASQDGRPCAPLWNDRPEPHRAVNGDGY